jgi:hypothetical protein
MEAQPGRKLVCQMISICAGETTLGHVMLEPLPILELCFMGYLAKGRTLHPPSQMNIKF